MQIFQIVEIIIMEILKKWKYPHFELSTNAYFYFDK